MYYYVEGTITQLFEACGLESMIELREVDDSEIRRDIYSRTNVFRKPGIKHALERYYLPEVQAEVPISKRYMQGDPDGGNLKFLMGSVPFHDENDPADSVEVGMQMNKSERAAYLDAQEMPAGISIYYRKDKPEQWMIVVTKNTHLPKDASMGYVLSSVDPRAFMTKDLGNVQEVTNDSFPQKLEQFADNADSPSIGELIKILINNDGTIKENPELLYQLFTRTLKENEKDVDDSEWLSFMEKKGAEIMANPLLIALHTAGVTGMSMEEIQDCLNDSGLSKALKSVLDDELLKKAPEIQKEKVQLVHNLYHLGRFDLWPILKDDTEGFIKFFNKIASDDKNDKLLKSILDKPKGQGLDCLRLIHKCKNSDSLMELICQSKDQNHLIKRLMDFIEFIDKASLNNRPKNDDVLSLTIQFILADLPIYPTQEIPSEFLKNDINDIKTNNYTPYQLEHFIEFKKLIGFLNKAEGLDKVKPELLFQFLSENLDNNEISNRFKSFKDTIVKLNFFKNGEF